MHQIINQLQQLQQQIAQVTQNLQGMQSHLQTITGQVQSKNAELSAMQPAAAPQASYASSTIGSSSSVQSALSSWPVRGDESRQNNVDGTVSAGGYGSQFAEVSRTGAYQTQSTQPVQSTSQFSGVGRPSQTSQTGSTVSSMMASQGFDRSALQSVMNADQASRPANQPGRQSEFSNYGRNL